VTGPFGLIPAQTRSGQSRPYFQLTIAPGRSARDVAIVSNEGKKTERLRIITSRGVTATNSSSAFVAGTGRCSGTSCWVSGLPHQVILAPGARRALPFRVVVPRGTRPAQYLAGITAESAIRPRAVRVGSNGHASAKAIIIDQVTVGVAVTVGRLSQLRTRLVVTRLSAGWIGSTPRLYLPVRNPGQTFARAHGTVSCRSDGRRHSYRVIIETVLPGGGAVVPVNALGLRTGSLPCTVRLVDSAGHPVIWSGLVNLPPRKITRIYHTANGVYVSLPANTIPPWAVALMVLGGLLVAGLVLVLIRSRRQLARPAGARGTRRRQVAWRPRRS
jgi:hypothetical protein